MRVPYGEGVATHTDPESCVVTRKGVGEALTGESAGRVLSREKADQGADAVERSGRRNRRYRDREVPWDPARSETPRMHGSTSHGNRESPWPSASDGGADRAGKSKDVIQR
jgi:RNA-directed DNA polymerase